MIGRPSAVGAPHQIEEQPVERGEGADQREGERIARNERPQHRQRSCRSRPGKSHARNWWRTVKKMAATTSDMALRKIAVKPAPRNTACSTGTRKMPTMNPPKPMKIRIEIVFVLQAAEIRDAHHHHGGHDQAGDDVAEIAAEEAVAVLHFDAGGEALADFGDRFAVRLVDGGAAARLLTQLKIARSPGGSAPKPPSGCLPVAVSVSVSPLSSKRMRPRTASDSAAAVKARHFSRPKPQSWM